MSETSSSDHSGATPSPHQQLMFPHEHLSALQAVNRRAISPFALIRQEAVLGLRWGKNLLSRKQGEKPGAKRELYEIFNDPVGAEVLQDKFLFGNLVRELGYQAPQSVLISSDVADDLVDQVIALNKSDSRRFCKPLGGTLGIGTYVARDAADAIQFARSQGNEYLIQTFEQERQDWRYILHRDHTQAESHTPPQWRIGYERVKPTVVGDGTSAIGQLVESDNSIPDYAKRKYVKYQHGTNRRNIEDIPLPGEPVEICDSANLAKGAYIRMPEAHELHNIDRFMLRFLQDLEERIGTQINTLAVDLGVKDASVLEASYDFEQMRQNVIFYEFQVPFGYGAYTQLVQSEKNNDILSHLLPKSLQRRIHSQELWRSFLKSLLVSGAKKQQKIN